MSVSILTDAPGGYVEIEASEIVSIDRWRAPDVVCVRFTNGDFVLVSGEVVQGHHAVWNSFAGEKVADPLRGYTHCRFVNVIA